MSDGTTMKVTATLTFKVTVAINNSWQDGASVRQIHNDAGTAARNLLSRLLESDKNVRVFGPVTTESVLVRQDP